MDMKGTRVGTRDLNKWCVCCLLFAAIHCAAMLSGAAQQEARDGRVSISPREAVLSRCQPRAQALRGLEKHERRSSVKRRLTLFEHHAQGAERKVLFVELFAYVSLLLSDASQPRRWHRRGFLLSPPGLAAAYQP